MRGSHYRDTWAEVDLGAIRHNAALAAELLGDDCRLMAIVKADGYGHGAVEAAQAALEGGASDLGVAFLDEALELRRAGVSCPILILGHTSEQAIADAIRHDVAITVFQDRMMEQIASFSAREGMRARVHIKIDTGMSRLGVRTADEAYKLASIALSNEGIELEGIYTHFAEADSEDDSFTREQFRRFRVIVRELAERGVTFRITHGCNSAATVKYPDMHLDMVRFGIGLYGLLPLRLTRSRGLDFRQAMSLRCCIAHLNRLRAGTAIGYGGTYRTAEESVIATLPIGYADGYSRMLSNKGEVLLRGTRATVAGNVCMDQLMINVSHIDRVGIGDEVTLFGHADGEELLIEEVALSMGSITYEVVTRIGARVPRVYVDRSAAAGTVLEWSDA